MAKKRVHELAKALGQPSNVVLKYLQDQGIAVTTSSSSVEEEIAQKVLKEFGDRKPEEKGGQTAPEKSEKSEKPAESEKPVKAQEPGKIDKPEKQEKPEISEKGNNPEKREEKTELRDKTENANKAADPEKAKKKKMVIVMNNQQHTSGGFNGRQNNGAGNSANNGAGSNAGRNSNSFNNNRQQQRPAGARPFQSQQGMVRPIKPLTPPSPTPSVQMVPDNHGMKKKPQGAPAADKKPENGQANVGAQNVSTTQNTGAQNTRPQGDRPVNGGTQTQNSSGYQNRSGQDNRGRGDFRGQDRNRPQDRDRNDRNNSGYRSYQNQDGRGADRPARGQNDRQNNYQNQNQNQRGFRPNKDGAVGEGRSNYANSGSNRNFNGSERAPRGNDRPGNQYRDNRDSRQGKGFAAEGAGKDMEKKREEDKRRFSQEKDKQRSKKDHFYEEEEALKNKPGRFIKPEKKKEEKAEEVIKVITLPDTVTIKDLADKMKIQPAAIIKKLFLEGKIVTVNQEISYEDAENIAMEYEILCEREVKVDVIEELLKEDEENAEDLVERPPVICVMGHVDHGKTSLLDAIRKTNVTDKEAGGITQHIGAYTVNVGSRSITFLDTPGHEAFTAMRMRGANSTDIAILVVAADDGVMPQTIEAINHAKAAGIEIIVAVNKIDKPSANIDRVKQELSEYELIPEDWGGSTVFAPVSAKTGEGIDQLLEMILLSADILELKANPKRKARGLVIEAELDKGRGPVATVLVQKGTLKVGDFISAGAAHGKVRAMIDDKGRKLKEATPSTPVEILGLNDVPSAGEVFIAHDSDKEAKNFADTYLAQNKEKKLEETKSRMSLEDLFSQIKEGSLKELNLIIKADVQGSVEAVKQSMLKLSNDEIVVKCIHGGVGTINESDVVLAGASNAIIIGFNVKADAQAKATAETEGVDVRLYNVIYQAIEDVEAAMKGMLDPIYEEKVIGHAEVRQIFKASAIGNIAGAYVLDGEFQRGCKIRITREGEQIYEGALSSLKRFKDDVKEVKAGFECGLVFEGFDKMQELDIVEAYIMVEVPR